MIAAPSKLQDLPNSNNDIILGLAPVAVTEEDPDDGYCEHVLNQPATISQVDPDLLHSEVALLPGKAVYLNCDAQRYIFNKRKIVVFSMLILFCFTHVYAKFERVLSL